MTKVTIDETTYSVTVAEENVNVTVADATETIQIQIASGASDTQVLSSGGGNSLVVGSTGGLTTLKSLSAGDNVTFSDDGNTITISSTEDDLSNNTTDDLAEGTTNLYYTDARVDSSLASVTGNIIPSVTDTYTLGSPTHVWQDLYLGQASLYIDGTRVIGSDVTGDINITTDPNQNIHIAAGQNVVFQSVVGATDQTFEVELDTINLGQDVGGATVTVRGTLEAPDIHVGDLELDASGIQQTQVGQNLTLKTSGTGFVYVETSDFYVGDVNTSAVKIDENSISRFGGGIVTIDGFTNSADMTTAINTAETNANTYTDTREIAITTAYQAYADQAEADAITTSNSYADTAIANLVDSAPATLDTLNELAAALGDDPNFATTVTNSIATKWTQDNTKISNWDTAYSWGDHSVEGYLTSYTETDPIFIGHVASSITSTEITNWNNAYGWGDHSLAGYLTSYTETDPVFTASPANGITATNISNWDTAYGWGDHSIVGYLTDYTVTEADVTQHQAALSITESQISDLTHFTTADARTAISLNSSNVNELSYDSTTGVFSYTSPTTVTAVGQVVFDVRNTSGVAISRGDAVYIAGNSGGKILVAKSDSNVTATMPAIGLANTAMNNNSDGTVLISGEMTSIDTSAFSEGDVLYVSETAGELTATRPSSASTKIQNIGKVARSDNQNGVIIVSGSGRANDVPNLDHLNVFIGNAGGVETRQLDTSDILEDATNLYYTDGRVQNWFGTTGIGMLSTDVVAEGSTNLYHTDARAISAVEAEPTLNLQEGLTIDTDIEIGDVLLRDTFATTGMKISNPATKNAWAGLVLEEYGGDYSSGQLPYNFHNPSISGEVHGGTPASPTAVSAYTRTASLIGNARYGTGSGESDTVGNITISTNENQTATNRGGKIGFNVNPTGGGTDTKEVMMLHADANANFVFDPNGDFFSTTISTQSTNGFYWDNSNTFLDDVQMDSSLNVSGLIKVNDGYTLSSFDPYSPAGLPSTAMSLSTIGVGQEEGWASVNIRSRGEHDWGLSGFGIPAEKPRALLNLSGGRLDGSSDDYLNNADNFGSILFNPYSGYRTGTEWLTPSAYFEAVATEDHSSSGMGTKLVLNTTENGNQAGAQDAAHTNASITIQGTTLSTSDTLKLDDDVVITGTTEFQGNLSSNGSVLQVDDSLKIAGSASTKNTVIGDSLIGTYDLHGFTVNAGDTAWAGINLTEHSGANKPIPNFTNPAFSTTIFGGTVDSPTAVETGKRVWSSFALTSPDGNTPSFANFRMLGTTTEQQSLTNRGVKFSVETTANGSNSTIETLVLQGDTLTVNSGADGKITTGGDLILDDDVTVTGTLNVNGNVTLGDANTDVVTATGKLRASNGFKNTVLDTNTANYLANVLGIVEVGDQGYISDGNGGTPCMAFYDGSNWKRMHSPTDNISST